MAHDNKLGYAAKVALVTIFMTLPTFGPSLVAASDGIQTMVAADRDSIMDAPVTESKSGVNFNSGDHK